MVVSLSTSDLKTDLTKTEQLVHCKTKNSEKTHDYYKKSGEYPECIQKGTNYFRSLY